MQAALMSVAHAHPHVRTLLQTRTVVAGREFPGRWVTPQHLMVTMSPVWLVFFSPDLEDGDPFFTTGALNTHLPAGDWVLDDLSTQWTERKGTILVSTYKQLGSPGLL